MPDRDPPIEEAELPEIPIQLLYNLNTGDLFLHRPDPTDQVNYKSFLLGALTKHLSPDKAMGPPNSTIEILGEYPLSSDFQYPFSYSLGDTYTLMSWVLEEPLPDVSSKALMHLGEILQSGTNINEITFAYTISNFVGTKEANIVRVPEPSTAALLLCCIVPAVLRRRR